MFEISTVMRKVNFIPTDNTMNGISQKLCIDKRKMVEELSSRIEEIYLRNVDESVPIYWVTAKMSRLGVARIPE